MISDHIHIINHSSTTSTTLINGTAFFKFLSIFFTYPLKWTLFFFMYSFDVCKLCWNSVFYSSVNWWVKLSFRLNFGTPISFLVIKLIDMCRWYPINGYDELLVDCIWLNLSNIRTIFLLFWARMYCLISSMCSPVN